MSRAACTIRQAGRPAPADASQVSPPLAQGLDGPRAAIAIAASAQHHALPKALPLRPDTRQGCPPPACHPQTRGARSGRQSGVWHALWARP